MYIYNIFFLITMVKKEINNATDNRVVDGER